MRDPRDARLAHLIIHHSTRLQRGEAVLIEAFDLHDRLVLDLVEEATRVGGLPVVSLRSNAVIRQLLIGGNEAQLQLQAAIEMFRMQKVQAYIGVRAADNVTELSDVPPERMKDYARLLQQPVHLEQRVNHTKWVVLRYPTPALAQLAGMSTEQFADFFYRVCTLDYARMAEAIVPLRERMSRTDRVHITGPGTDLRFRIQGMNVMPCEGRRNLPDGECYTAPVLDSVEGTIRYNTPSVQHGTVFTGVTFTFEGGRIVRATGDPQPQLDALLDTDEGARRVGEFSLGFNPHILHPMRDTLFDEKIAGSLRVTPGQAYAAADNGNRSAIHWDLVLIQRPEYGGGEVRFDDELIRKDGRFVPPELAGLNPERLGA
jgi:aminopeptidase